MRGILRTAVLSTAFLTSSAMADGISVAAFEEKEPGSEAALLRVMADQNYLRTDYGPDSEGFILFDRKARKLYSVSDEDRSVMIMVEREASPKAPAELQLQERAIADDKVPDIGGTKPLRYDFLARGSVCRSVYAVPGLLPEMTLALKEFKEFLAGEQARQFATVPEAQKSPCDLATHVYAPSRHLAHGFPIREWDGGGYSRVLVSFKENQSLDGQWNQLPADYRQFSLDEEGFAPLGQ